MVILIVPDASPNQLELKRCSLKQESAKLTIEVDGKRYQDTGTVLMTLWQFLKQLEAAQKLNLTAREGGGFWQIPVLIIGNKEFMIPPPRFFQLSLRQLGIASASLLKLKFQATKVGFMNSFIFLHISCRLISGQIN